MTMIFQFDLTVKSTHLCSPKLHQSVSLAASALPHTVHGTRRLVKRIFISVGATLFPRTVRAESAEKPVKKAGFGPVRC